MTIRSTRRSAPAGATSAWSIGCRSIYETLETIFDYLPDAAVVLDHQAEECATTRIAAIADFYEARRDAMRAGARRRAPVYRPVRPEQALSRRRGMEQGARPPPRRPVQPVHRAGGRAAHRRCRRAAGARASPRRAPIRRSISSTPCAITSASEAQAGRRVLIAAYSAGSAERLTHAAARAWRRRAAPGRRAGTSSGPLPADGVGVAVLAIEHGYRLRRHRAPHRAGHSRRPPGAAAAAARQFRAIHRRGRGAAARRSRRPCRAWHRPL